MDTDIVTKDYADLESIKTRIYDIRGLKVMLEIPEKASKQEYRTLSKRLYV